MSYCADKLKAQIWVKFYFELKFDFKVQGQLPNQNNRDLNQGVFQIWSKFGDPSLKGHELLCGQAHDWPMEGWTDKPTNAGNNNIRRPKLASGNKNTKMWYFSLSDSSAIEHVASIPFRHPTAWLQ